MAVRTRANEPARLAAIAAGDKRYSSSFPCEKNPAHVWRYAEGTACAECGDLKYAAKDRANRPASEIALARRDDIAPTIGGDVDETVNNRRLVRATEKFLKALYAEKLQAIRSGVVPHEKATA
jgi:hypothetical protein